MPPLGMLGEPAVGLQRPPEPSSTAEDEEEKEVRPTALLVNCDLGHNRSPTLVLAYLLRIGFPLREAYKKVFRTRPTIDPLPNYRHGLVAMEKLLRGFTSVWEEEPFHMHISELLHQVCCIHPVGAHHVLPTLSDGVADSMGGSGGVAGR